MKKLFIMIGAFVVCCAAFIAFSLNNKPEPKISGVSFVAPHKPIESKEMEAMRLVNAKWVAIIPYAFSRADESNVTFNHDRQWWGERSDGTVKTIKMAQELGYKIMLKPHVWVRGQGWAGDFALNDEVSWLEWEDAYRGYIMTYAKIADSLNVDLLCIGTEYRKAVVSRPEFWNTLIDDVRLVYSGKITYAANWDNFENVTFWSKLDYIGLDAYFPLSNQKTPDVKTLNDEWNEVLPSITAVQKSYNKPVLFTEYGYQSIDFSAGGHWNYNQDTLAVNLTAQANAYEALYESLWNKEWFAGGFLWKWHAWHDEYGGDECKRFTPQNKPAQQVIAKWYN